MSLKRKVISLGIVATIIGTFCTGIKGYENYKMEKENPFLNAEISYVKSEFGKTQREYLLLEGWTNNEIDKYNRTSNIDSMLMDGYYFPIPQKNDPNRLGNTGIELSKYKL